MKWCVPVHIILFVRSACRFVEGLFKPFSPFRRRSMERSWFLLFFEVWFFVPGEGN